MFARVPQFDGESIEGLALVFDELVHHYSCVVQVVQLLHCRLHLLLLLLLFFPELFIYLPQFTPLDLFEVMMLQELLQLDNNVSLQIEPLELFDGRLRPDNIFPIVVDLPLKNLVE